jgi:hypothetical protein
MNVLESYRWVLYLNRAVKPADAAPTTEATAPSTPVPATNTTGKAVA